MIESTLGLMEHKDKISQNIKIRFLEMDKYLIARYSMDFFREYLSISSLISIHFLVVPHINIAIRLPHPDTNTAGIL
jgi:hypothetical protein